MTKYRAMFWDDRHDACIYAIIVDAPNEEAAEGMLRQTVEQAGLDYFAERYPVLVEEVDE